jgi:hypothetical protein
MTFQRINFYIKHIFILFQVPYSAPRKQSMGGNVWFALPVGANHVNTKKVPAHGTEWRKCGTNNK